MVSVGLAELSTQDPGSGVDASSSPEETSVLGVSSRKMGGGSSSSLKKIALTGGAGYLGLMLLKHLLKLPEVDEVHVFDVRAPLEVHSNKLFFHRLDLTRDTADTQLAEVLLERDIGVFIHGALFADPSHFSAKRREVESIGTFHILNAVAEAQCQHLYVLSSTFVYGASTDNPNFLKEVRKLPSSGPDFVRTRVDVEKQVAEFAREYRSCRVTTLRFAPILGPNAHHTMARYFIAGIIPKVMGYDPLLQFVHEEDAIRAVLLALRLGLAGTFNIVGKGVLPLSTGIHISGRFPVALPSFLVQPVFELGHQLRVWGLSRSMVPFFMYLCVADGQKAKSVLGFEAKYSSRQALKSMIEANRLSRIGFGAPTPSLGEERPAQGQPGFERIS